MEKRSELRIPIRAVYLVVFLSIMLGGSAFADGGVARISQRSGPFQVTIFTASPTVRAGPEDVSVLVQDHSTYQPLLNAKVWLSIRRLNKHAATSKEAWTPPCCRMKSDLTVRR